eukprot:2965292-Rhodomonas_salina.3
MSRVGHVAGSGRRRDAVGHGDSALAFEPGTELERKTTDTDRTWSERVEPGVKFTTSQLELQRQCRGPRARARAFSGWLA